MEHAIRTLLTAIDDPDHPESPPGLDRSAVRQRMVALRPELERIAGHPFVLDDDWRGTPIFGQLTIRGPVSGGGAYDGIVIGLSFSNFGGLFITFRFGAERLPERVVSELVATTERAGFRYVESGEMYDEPYSGPCPWFRGANWYQRYFGVHPDGIHAFEHKPDSRHMSSDATDG